MKPRDLVFKRWIGNLNGHSLDIEVLQRYFDKDCVIAYLKYPTGSLFIIRSKRECHGFVYSLFDMGLNIKKVMGEDMYLAIMLIEKYGTIINEEEFKKHIAKMVTRGL